MNRDLVVRNAWAELPEHLDEQGFELVEVEYTKQGKTPILRLFIDKEGGGITLDDCVKATQLLNPVLDLCDFVPEEYGLEVSSPGIDRPVRKEADFERFAGEAVKMQTREAVDGRKRFTGILHGLRDGMVVLEDSGTEYEIHLENIKKANLDR